MNEQVETYLSKSDKIDLQSELGFPCSVRALFGRYDSTATEIESMVESGAMLMIIMIGINAMLPDPVWDTEDIQPELMSDVYLAVGNALFNLERDDELPNDVELAGIQEWLSMRPYQLWKHANESRRMLGREEETFWNLLSEECFVRSFMESARAWHEAFVMDYMNNLVPYEGCPTLR